MGQTERVVDTKVTKKQVQQRVTHYGVPLALSKFEWDEAMNTFSAKEDDLVIDFGGLTCCTFNTGDRCTFNTEGGCTFNTGHCCTFSTGNGCTFNTRFGCTFKTGGVCTFRAGYDCIFGTLGACTWVIDGRSYPFAPLFIQGSAWSVNVFRPGYLKIGCEVHTFTDWDKYAAEVAAAHDTSPEHLEEYLGLIKLAREWAKQKGWLIPK